MAKYPIWHLMKLFPMSERRLQSEFKKDASFLISFTEGRGYFTAIAAFSVSFGIFFFFFFFSELINDILINTVSLRFPHKLNDIKRCHHSGDGEEHKDSENWEKPETF